MSYNKNSKAFEGFPESSSPNNNQGRGGNGNDPPMPTHPATDRNHKISKGIMNRVLRHSITPETVLSDEMEGVYDISYRNHQGKHGDCSFHCENLKCNSCGISEKELSLSLSRSRSTPSPSSASSPSPSSLPYSTVPMFTVARIPSGGSDSNEPPTTESIRRMKVVHEVNCRNCLEEKMIGERESVFASMLRKKRTPTRPVMLKLNDSYLSFGEVTCCRICFRGGQFEMREVVRNKVVKRVHLSSSLSSSSSSSSPSLSPLSTEEEKEKEEKEIERKVDDGIEEVPINPYSFCSDCLSFRFPDISRYKLNREDKNLNMEIERNERGEEFGRERVRKRESESERERERESERAREREAGVKAIPPFSTEMDVMAYSGQAQRMFLEQVDLRRIARSYMAQQIKAAAAATATASRSISLSPTPSSSLSLSDSLSPPSSSSSSPPSSTESQSHPHNNRNISGKRKRME